jgi:hypothetical protein
MVRPHLDWHHNALQRIFDFYSRQGRAIQGLSICVTKPTLHFFVTIYFLIFVAKTIRRVMARRFSLWDIYETNQKANRLDNHLHSWLARPTTLRLCQHRAPNRSNAYTL